MRKIRFRTDVAKKKGAMRTKKLSKAIVRIAVAVLSAATLSADSITFSLLPGDGAVSGAAGSLVGWGYSITNNSAADWFLATDLNSDSFSNGAPTPLFDFPEVGPGQIVTEAFDAVNSIGLFELQWDVTAPAGFVNAGNFILSGQWWNGDPLNGGSVIAVATDVALPYSAYVSGGPNSGAPEPAGTYLLVLGIALTATWRLKRSGRER